MLHDPDPLAPKWVLLPETAAAISWAGSSGFIAAVAREIRSAPNSATLFRNDALHLDDDLEGAGLGSCPESVVGIHDLVELEMMSDQSLRIDLMRLYGLE